jgi:heptosyltransferase-1
MRILLIKTSSLGDVVHNLPVVTDLRRRYPEARIDWVVEEGFLDIPRLHPGLGRAIAVAIRRWRRTFLSRATWREIRAFHALLDEQRYDLVIDTQGLLKSALIARQTHGKRCGYAAASAREPLAAMFYDAKFVVPRNLHAVERNRRLSALAAGYEISEAPDYGIAAVPSATAGGPGAVLLTASSRADKLWAEDHWVSLGRSLHDRGLACLLPAGSEAEHERALRLANAIPGAVALPPLSLRELAGRLAAARIVIGVDTGLVHLAAALGRPTLALFCASDPALTGVLAGTPVINLGTRGQPPDVDAAIAAADALL